MNCLVSTWQKQASDTKVPVPNRSHRPPTLTIEPQNWEHPPFFSELRPLIPEHQPFCSKDEALSFIDRPLGSLSRRVFGVIDIYDP